MPGPLLHLGATVMCSHTGTAQPLATNPRVLVDGMATVLVPGPPTYAIAACALSGSTGPFCVTGLPASTTRVLSNGMPLAVALGLSSCPATGLPLVVTSSQTRVIAT
jgi:hypothetical protein